jgi:3-hydroxybutyryl-CoA dehydrogenase
VLSRVGATADFDAAVAGADFVIEAVPEDIALKLRIFARLEMLCREHVVLATNTSALSVTEIAAAVKRPARVLGMHFFNPVPKMKLVEIIRALGPETRRWPRPKRSPGAWARRRCW